MKKFCMFIVMLSCSLVLVKAQDMKMVVDSLKKIYAPDSRTSVWNVECIETYKAWKLKGEVDNDNKKATILAETVKLGVNIVDSIVVLENSMEKPWGLVMLSIASLRTDGRHAAEMATQAIMGTPVKLLQKKGDWYRVQTPDNYISYIPGNSIKRISESQLLKWKNSVRYIVTAYQSRLVEKPGSDATVSDLVLGNILEYKGKKGKWIELSTPDGRSGYLPASDVKEFSEWSRQKFNANVIESTARRMMGSGYLWGGTSTKVTDCSGLAKVCYFANGIILQRDASQQALYGRRMKPAEWKSSKCGDLVFFGTSTGRVTHVGIYLRGGKYIHCSGRVKINSVDTSASDYLSTPFLSISRIDGEIDTPGIVAVRNHSWYFDK